MYAYGAGTILPSGRITLKADAQRRVKRAKVQNYHGIVYPSLVRAGIQCGLGESIRRFNTAFRSLSTGFPRYYLLVVDEYQDITEEYAQLLRNIKSLNPVMQVLLVGDLAQKVRSDTTLDVQRFTREFTQQAALLPFTQSFRIGPELGALLAEAWNKPVVGVNRAQTIRYASYDEALEFLSANRPGDLLCLGKRNGQMAEALNHLERTHPGVFNKKTVYASIRDGDISLTYGDDAAVFTTFDSSKGLEPDGERGVRLRRGDVGHPLRLPRRGHDRPAQHLPGGSLPRQTRSGLREVRTWPQAAQEHRIHPRAALHATVCRSATGV